MDVPAGDISVAAACGAAMHLLEAGKIWHAEISVRTGLGASAVGIVADAVSRRGARRRGRRPPRPGPPHGASARQPPDVRATARKKLIYLFRARRRQWK